MEPAATIEREATTMNDKATLGVFESRIEDVISNLKPIRDRNKDSDVGRQLSLAITELEGAQSRVGRAIDQL